MIFFLLVVFVLVYISKKIVVCKSRFSFRSLIMFLLQNITFIDLFVSLVSSPLVPPPPAPSGWFGPVKELMMMEAESLRRPYLRRIATLDAHLQAADQVALWLYTNDL